MLRRTKKPCNCTHCLAKEETVIPAIPENLWETYKDARRMEVDAQMKVLHLEVAVQNATQRQMYECEVEMATLRHEIRKEHDFFQNQLEFKTPGDISKDGTKVLFVECCQGTAFLDKEYVNLCSRGARSARELLWRLVCRHFTGPAIITCGIEEGHGLQQLHPPTMHAICSIVSDVASSVPSSDPRKENFSEDCTSISTIKESLRRLRQHIRSTDNYRKSLH